jgi:energy-coupling factor transporter ATP-binding protein EcfA2
MGVGLQSIRLQRFKRIIDAPLDIRGINVLVGGNNSGKSSVIQGLHFGIALLQTVALTEKWTTSDTQSTSLNPNQLIYSPSEDVYALGHGGKLPTDEKQAISLDLTLATGELCSLNVRKGKNRNIFVTVENTKLGQQLSNLEKPFSVFSPGLAGIAKRETYVSDGVLFRTLARGDANLVLRNILLRLWNTPAQASFLNDLRDVFPDLEISVGFESKVDEFINVTVKTGKERVPLEISGTGVLQAMQILSYIHRFEPAIVVLDEPDSHLHPNNQRLLCSLLRRVSEERGTQVLLTTHSRHVIDALGSSATMLWVRNGTVDKAGVDDELGILLEIGALDVKERAGQPNTEAVVLTEDEISRPLETVLQSSDFNLPSTAVLPYYGVTGIKQLRPLVKIIQRTNTKAKIVVHRDRDFLEASDASAWESDVRALGVEPFLTKRRDIESYFIDAKYLAKVNAGVSEIEFEDVISTVLAKQHPQLVSDYVNGKLDLARKGGKISQINHGTLAVEAHTEINGNARKYAGKAILRAVRAEFQTRYGKNMISSQPDSLLRDPSLAAIAKKSFKSKSHATPPAS